MDVRGHADYCEKGKDIVCAGVSTLVFTLAFAVDGYEAHRGGIYIKCPNASKKPIFDAIVNGLKMIENDYPENLLITEGGEGLKYRPRARRRDCRKEEI